MAKDASLENLIDYIAAGDGQPRAWGDARLTVDLGGLRGEMLDSARAALELWTATTGLKFREVADGADITFGSREPGAFTQIGVSGDGEILSAEVNVSKDWMDAFPRGERWGTGDYGLQTFVHEIGHALGLQHPGPYNGTGNYSDDAIFTKDTWQYSIMSYFDQSNLDGNDPYFISGPALADVAAIKQLYGELEVRPGDNTYDLSSMFLAEGVGTYTLVDDGGTDTIDITRGFGAVSIDLRAGVFSFVNQENDLAIAIGTTIENVIGSNRAPDLILGNEVGNVLDGGAWGDVLDGREGADTLIGGVGRKGGGEFEGDKLIGGGGADLFVFRSAAEIKNDWIRDFKSGVDQIKLSRIDANDNKNGNQSFEFVGGHEFSGDAGELRFEERRFGTFLLGDTDGDQVADFELQFGGKARVDGDDILL